MGVTWVGFFFHQVILINLDQSCRATVVSGLEWTTLDMVVHLHKKSEFHPVKRIWVNIMPIAQLVTENRIWL